MKWFKHDSDASSDAKIKKLIIRHGAIGYAVYFHCLELIMADVSESKITFELEHDAEIIADNLKITGSGMEAGVDIVNRIMNTIIDLDLFRISGDKIFCLKLAKRLDSSMTSNPRFREMIKNSHDTIMISHDLVMQEETRTDITRNKEKINKKENPQPPTNWDDDEPAITYPKPQPEIPPSQDPIQESASELIGQIINHWNSKKNLPNCRYQSFSIPGISDFTAKLSVFSLSEIIKSIDNLGELWEKIEPKYRHRTLSKFIVKIDDWTDEAEPWERYKSGSVSTVSPEEAERLAAEAFPSRGGT